jgi:hypothetical protein
MKVWRTFLSELNERQQLAPHRSNRKKPAPQDAAH